MKERPILFSGEMVKAILEGRKTMTRRMMKVQPPNDGADYQAYRILAGDRRNIGKCRWVNKNCLAARVNAPYFSLPWENGDRLWVKETFSVDGIITGSNSNETFSSGCIEYKYGRAKYFNFSTNPSEPEEIPFDDYRREKLIAMYDSQIGDWRPSIFMPRWASRITLEITDISVERLQDITEEDAIAEGIHLCAGIDEEGYTHGYHWGPVSDAELLFNSAADAYRKLWDSINGQKPGKTWNDNPWVWVIEFKEVK